MERRGRNRVWRSLGLILIILTNIEPPPWPDSEDTKTQSHQRDCRLGGWTGEMTSAIRSHMCHDPCTKNKQRHERGTDFSVWRGANLSKYVEERDTSYVLENGCDGSSSSHTAHALGRSKRVAMTSRPASVVIKKGRESSEMPKACDCTLSSVSRVSLPHLT